MLLRANANEKSDSVFCHITLVFFVLSCNRSHIFKNHVLWMSFTQSVLLYLFQVLVTPDIQKVVLSAYFGLFKIVKSKNINACVLCIHFVTVYFPSSQA